MDEFKGRWQALQSEEAGSLAGGALARSVAECFMAGYQLALDRTFDLKTPLGSPRGERGFEGHRRSRWMENQRSPVAKLGCPVRLISTRHDSSWPRPRRGVCPN